MSDNRYQIIQQFQEFRQHFDTSVFTSRDFLLYSSGWLISFYMAIHPSSFLPDFLAVIAYFYFLFKLIDEIQAKLQPFAELLLFCFCLLYGIEYLLLNAFWPAAAFTEPPGTHSNFFILNFQILMLAVLHLLFSIVLVKSNNGKKGILVAVFFIGIICNFYVEHGNRFLFYTVLVALFFTLLKRTTWLESLTRRECWIYLIVIFFSFQWFASLNLFNQVETGVTNYSNAWFAVPFFLYHAFRIYLLTLMVRIPGVLIYNHATLERKLRIAGLFQSTFPQLVQLAVMMLIFYVFISGWQAQNLRDSLQQQIRQIEAGTPAAGLNYYEVSALNKSFPLDLGRYRPVAKKRWIATDRLPAKGIIAMRNTEDRTINGSAAIHHFLFFKSMKPDSSESLFLVKVDSTFLATIGKNLIYLGGTSLLSYQVNTEKWPLYSNKVELWGGDSEIKIFPLGVVNYDTQPLRTQLQNQDTEDTINIQLGIFPDGEFTLGRIFLKTWSPENGTENYLAIDIVKEFTSRIQWSGMLQVLLLVTLIYLLLNSFIIRSMVNFGSQINKTIVQKFGNLKKGIQEVSAGNLNYKMKFEGEDEFVELADHFNEMSDQLKQTLNERREKDRLQYEMQNARNVQISLLPRSLPNIPGYQISASLHTATEVGGDFYDMFALDEHRYLFTVGDVSGKGSSAALYMAQCMSLIRYTRQFTDDPLEICRRLNSYFTATAIDRQIFVTAIIGILDASNHTIKWVRAGHTEPLLLPGSAHKKVQFLPSKGLGIGLTQQEEIFKKSQRLKTRKMLTGDTLIFYTDGVIEASKPLSDATAGTPERETFDEEQLEALLTQHRDKTPDEIKSEIEFSLQSFYAGHPRVDDHTLLIIRKDPNPRKPEPNKFGNKQ